MTRTGDLVIDLDSPHKKPYETLIIGRFKAKTVCDDDNIGESTFSDQAMFNSAEREFIEHTTVGKDDTKCKETNGLKSIPNQMVICSVPCQIHSRKPPLSGKYIIP